VRGKRGLYTGIMVHVCWRQGGGARDGREKGGRERERKREKGERGWRCVECIFIKEEEEEEGEGEGEGEEEEEE